MKPLAVAFLWHMHQPMYKDPLSKKVLMPWVRLHCLKGYNDMIRLAQDYPAVHQNFNLVPSLLAQIEDTLANPAADVYWQASAKPAADLNAQDKELLRDDFFMAHADTMIKPYPRYAELLAKRNNSEEFSRRDFLDLQVYFNLVWFGYMAHKDYPVLKELLHKGADFTEAEKNCVLDTQIKVVRDLLPAYKKAQDSGQVEISVSPFYHPILPLLMDTEFAKRAMPWAPLPERFTHPEDARAQIVKALDKAQQVFGKRPKGMWPSEGSVCEELVELLADALVEWIATDEEILLQSLSVEDRGHALYKPYIATHKKKSVAVVFRDHSLSDLIGFVYSKNDPARSADDMLGHLTNIHQHLQDVSGPRLVSIILDGENPWEYYSDGGEAFLRRLFERLSDEKIAKTTTLGDFILEHPPTETIAHLHSGSWISHNYDIWIGSSEENTAWNLLKKTREFLVDYLRRYPHAEKAKLDMAWEEIYMAEGSDWFWWYGDDFSTDNDAMFDQLFRMHLANVYRLLDHDVPETLKIAIAQEETAVTVGSPVGFISPILDGKVTHFYEWQEGGYLNTRSASSATMYRADGILQSLHYGFDLHHLYLRLDMLMPDRLKKKAPLVATVHVVKPPEYKIVFPLQATGKQGAYELSHASDGIEFKKIKESHTIAVETIVEISVPFADLKAKTGDELQFFIQVRHEKIELERVPKNGFISVQVPDEEFESKMWSV